MDTKFIKNDPRLLGKNNPNYNGGKNISCVICGKDIYVKPCQLKRRKTCSKKCMAIYYSHSKCGENSPTWKGKITKICPICKNSFQLSKWEEKRIYCSIKCKGIALSCKNAPNWKGGTSLLPYAPTFNKYLKMSILKRDNFICQSCGITKEEELKIHGRKLAIHHIDYNKQNCSLENLITTCCTCNSKANYNIEYWISYFKGIIDNFNYSKQYLEHGN